MRMVRLLLAVPPLMRAVPWKPLLSPVKVIRSMRRVVLFALKSMVPVPVMAAEMSRWNWVVEVDVEVVA